MQLTRIFLAGGLMILVVAMLSRFSARCAYRHGESLLDEALDETFPASDPTATQDFSAPDDRRK